MGQLRIDVWNARVPVQVSDFDPSFRRCVLPDREPMPISAEGDLVPQHESIALRSGAGVPADVTVGVAIGLRRNERNLLPGVHVPHAGQSVDEVRLAIARTGGDLRDGDATSGAVQHDLADHLPDVDRRHFADRRPTASQLQLGDGGRCVDDRSDWLARLVYGRLTGGSENLDHLGRGDLRIDLAEQCHNPRHVRCRHGCAVFVHIRISRFG